MSAFFNQWKAEMRSKVPVVLWLIISAVIAVSGPFGSYGSFGLGGRLLFWLPVVGIGVLIIAAIRTYITYHKWQFTALQALILSTVLACLVLCPALYVLTTAAFSNLGSDLARFGEMIFLVASVAMGATALQQAWAQDPQTDGLAHDVQNEVPRLIGRLGPDHRGDLLAICVRDHYVEIQTTKGTACLLMRFGDAIAEAAPVEGAQVHRSYWVAWAAVEAVERDGIKLFLRLSHGGRVPVSKNHRAKLEDRGLI